MSKKKQRVPKTKVKDADFIPLSTVQRNYLNEVLVRTNREFSQAVQSVYDDLGISAKVNKDPEKYILRKGFAGIDVLTKEQVEQRRRAVEQMNAPRPTTTTTPPKSGKSNKQVAH